MMNLCRFSGVEDLHLPGKDFDARNCSCTHCKADWCWATTSPEEGQAFLFLQKGLSRTLCLQRLQAVVGRRQQGTSLQVGAVHFESKEVACVGDITSPF